MVVVLGSSSVVVVLVSSSAANTCLLILCMGGGCLLFPESEFAAGAGSVVVRWARAISLLFLMVADEQDLHDGRAQEEESSDDRDGEHGGIEAARCAKVNRVGEVFAAIGADAVPSEAIICVRWAIADWSLHNSLAGVRAVSRQDCDCDHASGEEDVEDDG